MSLPDLAVLVTASVHALNPEPELRPGLDPEAITPGLLGFVVTFGAVLLLVVLVRSLTGKLRKVEHQRRREEEHASTQGAPHLGPGESTGRAASTEPGAPVG